MGRLFRLVRQFSTLSVLWMGCGAVVHIELHGDAVDGDSGLEHLLEVVGGIIACLHLLPVDLRGVEPGKCLLETVDLLNSGVRAPPPF